MSFGPKPPTIPGDNVLRTLNVTKLFTSFGTYNNNIDGVPLSVNNSGLLGVTPVVSKTFPVGVTPAAIAITPDGTKAYVANNNNYGITGSDSVTVLDLISGIPLMTITDVSFNQPYTITISEDGETVYVTNSFTTTITIINNDEVIGTITGFDGPSGMVIKGTTAFVNNYGAGGNSGLGDSVSIVDLTMPAITGSITVGLAPSALALSIDKRYLYVAMYDTGDTNSGFINVYDTDNNNVLVDTITNLSGPFDIAVNPNGLKLYITNFGSNNFTPYGNTISVISTSSNTITNTITVGIQPAGAVVSPNGKFLYVTNYNTLYNTYDLPVNSPGTGTVTVSNLIPGQGTVSIINTETEEVVSPTIIVGQSPSAATIDPSGKYLYVTNFGYNTVSGIYINQLV
jgi:YVTN family beta-propeller protein